MLLSMLFYGLWVSLGHKIYSNNGPHLVSSSLRYIRDTQTSKFWQTQWNIIIIKFQVENTCDKQDGDMWHVLGYFDSI